MNGLVMEEQGRELELESGLTFEEMASEEFWNTFITDLELESVL